jgi:uncharacterized protein YjiS (DUF1127 family)
MTTLIATADTIGLTGVAAWLKELNAKRIERAAINRTIKQLSALSDRELWDIGISRGDIYNVARGDDTLERVRRNNLKTNSNLEGWV